MPLLAFRTYDAYVGFEPLLVVRTWMFILNVGLDGCENMKIMLVVMLVILVMMLT